MPAADLNRRLLWWMGCIATTAMGLYFLHRGSIQKASLVPALVLLAFPHVVFTPPLPAIEPTGVPVGLATQFVTSSLGANLAMWIVIGVGLGYALKKFESVFGK